MKLLCVGSGSDGNCYLLEHEDHYLVLDAGCKRQSVLIACDFKPSAIDAVLVTHAHGDHAKYIKEFRQDSIEVYTGWEQAVTISEIFFQRCKVLQEKRWNKLPGGWKVLPFSVPHDGIANFAYIIENPSGTHRVLYATDFEYLPVTMKSFLIQTWLLECNYSGDLDPGEHYNKLAHVLRGHSSLDTVKDIIAANICDSTKNIILCHLSASNADSELIIQTIKELVNPTTQVTIAEKGKTYQL